MPITDYERLKGARALSKLNSTGGGGGWVDHLAEIFGPSELGCVHYLTKFNLVCRIRHLWLHLNRLGNYGFIYTHKIAAAVLTGGILERITYLNCLLKKVNMARCHP